MNFSLKVDEIAYRINCYIKHLCCNLMSRKRIQCMHFPTRGKHCPETLGYVYVSWNLHSWTTYEKEEWCLFVYNCFYHWFVKKLTQMYHQILIGVGDNDFINVKSHRYMSEIEATISCEPKAKTTYFTLK